jgi:signal transduction histidine kinase
MQRPAVSAVSAVEPRTGRDAEHAHAAQFYEDDDFLCGVLADFVVAAVASHRPALLIATEPHRQALLSRLATRGFDADQLAEAGRLLLLDAGETLDTFMVDGSPDATRFQRSVGRLLRRCEEESEGEAVAVYGEMVDVLCREENSRGALRLEELWGRLARHHEFSLLCGYSIDTFSSASQTEDFLEICRLHDHARPTERFTRLEGGAQLTEISALQQRARALETELVHSRELEQRLLESLAEKARLLEDEHTARAEAEAANRAKSDFLAVMNHELRTPLNAISGYADLLDLGIHGPLSEKQKDWLERIQRSQRHLLGLIDTVLSYAGSEAGGLQFELDSVPVDDLLRAADVCVLPQLHEKGILYSYAGCDRSIAAYADGDKVGRILVNLLVNAIKFTEPGGQIRLEGDATDEQVFIRLRDTGIGIAPEQLDDIFEPFVQVDSRLTRLQSGVGLGLAISRELARGMGGDLSASSTPGAGSTFTLTLRRAQPCP